MELADAIVARVLIELKRLGRVAPTYMLSYSRRPVAWMVSRTTNTLVGREADVQLVRESLQQHGTVVIWGAPGAGKTAVAMEAAAQLRQIMPALCAFELDMRGEHCMNAQRSGTVAANSSLGNGDLPERRSL